MQNAARQTAGSTLVVLPFKVNAPSISENTECKFEFVENKTFVSAALSADAIGAQKVENGSITLEPVTYTVKLTGDNGVTFAKEADGTTAITSDTVKHGNEYSVYVKDYKGGYYVYEVQSLTIGGVAVEGSDLPTVGDKGVIKIPGTSVTGNIELTVSRSENFTIRVVEDYVSGYCMVVLTENGESSGIPYAYDGKPMYKMTAYSGKAGHDVYAYLVKGLVEEADAKAAVTYGTAEGTTIQADNDVNGSGKVDYSDALLAYRCYLVGYETPIAAMEYYLHADVYAGESEEHEIVDTEDAKQIYGALSVS